MHSSSIIIIDDNVQIWKVPAITLQSNSHKVTVAATGQEALLRMAHSSPDLILLSLSFRPSFLNETQLLMALRAQLRKKIENDPEQPLHILAEAGIGYRFIGNIAPLI